MRIWTPGVLVLALALAAGPGHADPYEDAIPLFSQEGGPKRRPAGFAEATLREPVVSRVENPRTGDFSLTILPKNVRVELVHPELDGVDEVRVLLGDGRMAWVPPRSLDPRADSATFTPAELYAAEDERSFTPFRNLPAGLRYRFLYRQGARLHLVIADLRENPYLELFPSVTARYNREVSGSEQVASVKALAERNDAFVALNGPFFIPWGRNRGKPLGVLIAEGKVLFELEDPFVLGLNRTYLAYTNAGRFVMGETNEPGEAILRKNRQDLFDRHLLGEGERIVSLVGGLGRLGKDGDPRAWRIHAGHQFSARYYGRTARRPQALLGVGEEGRVLYALVQEGYPHSERCFTLPELSHVLHALGAEHIAFSDGGGSAELVVMGRNVVRTENAGPRRPNSTVVVLRERRLPGGPGTVALGTLSNRSYR